MIFRLITLEGNEEDNKQGTSNMWVNAECVENWSVFCYGLKDTYDL